MSNHVKPVSHLVRFEGVIAAGIDTWVSENSHLSRTAAINHMCKFFLEAIEIERLRRDNADLRKKVVNLAMDHRPMRPCNECSMADSEHCKSCPWPKIYAERLTK